MTRLDDKLARIKAGRYNTAPISSSPTPRMPIWDPASPAPAPNRQPDGSWSRYRTRAEFLDQIQAVIDQDIVDIMLVSASNLELLHERKAFKAGRVKPAIRANRHDGLLGRPCATAPTPGIRPATSAARTSIA